MKIVIIGGGNVGTNLHYGFALKGIKAELVSGWAVCRGEKDVVPPADVYIYTVADHVLAEVVSHVHAPKAIHLHTSGTMPISVFGEDKPHAGVLYFLQSFSQDHLIDEWQSIPCFIEGRNIDDVAAIYSLAQNLTSRIYEANQHDRERLHIAGVFANNYSNLMFRFAHEVLRDTQIPFEALLPLIDRTAAKVHAMHPADAQTGPAKRGDEAVIKHHLDILSQMNDGVFSHSDLYSVYQSLAALIAKGRSCPTPPTAGK